MNVKIKELTLTPESNERLINLCGPLDDNLRQLEHQLNVVIHRYNNFFKLIGMSISDVEDAADVLISLYNDTKINYSKNSNVNPEQVNFTVRHIQRLKRRSISFHKNQNNIISMQTSILLKNKTIKPKTINQAQYINNIFNHDITFGIGPSGTGKTYLAIAVAIDLLERKTNQHLILSRPAIEAGEKLGYLPGDFNQKADPYIRPLYDALYDILGYERMEQFIQKNMIEVIPLGYMRGRTFNNAIVILDESQNTTVTQMKMFLTRIGFNSKAIITGDVTQVDLPINQQSGLKHAIKILSIIKDISFNFFNKEDSVRHSIITRIIDAYETYNIK